MPTSSIQTPSGCRSDSAATAGLLRTRRTRNNRTHSLTHTSIPRHTPCALSRQHTQSHTPRALSPRPAHSHDNTLKVTRPSLLSLSTSEVLRSALPGVRTPLLILSRSRRNVRATWTKRMGVATYLWRRRVMLVSIHRRFSRVEHAVPHPTSGPLMRMTGVCVCDATCQPRLESMLHPHSPVLTSGCNCLSSLRATLEYPLAIIVVEKL